MNMNMNSNDPLFQWILSKIVNEQKKMFYVHVFVWAYLKPSIVISVCPYIHPSIHPIVRPSVRLTVRPSTSIVIFYFIPSCVLVCTKHDYIVMAISILGFLSHSLYPLMLVCIQTKRKKKHSQQQVTNTSSEGN